MIQTSRKAQRELRSRKDDLETIRIGDLKFILSEAAGRRFVFDLIDRRCLVFSPSYTGNSETYLREGMRKVGIEMMQEVQKLFPEQYVKMINEQFNLQRQNALVEEGAKRLAAEDDQ